MVSRRHLALVLLGALASMGASFRTTNFVINAPTPQIAQQMGQLAERYRKEKALEWLGQEMPPWNQPCPVRVTVTMSGAGGATTFAFDQGRILEMKMQIEGSLDRLMVSVLPHEVTHTVLAHHFRQPLPRWADEGGAVLSEDDVERNRHDMLVRQFLNTGRAMPLRRLFSLMDYPRDVMVLYAQGFSVVNWLVGSRDRRTFLGFVAHGMRSGWDSAAQTFYRYRSVEELEQAWLTHMRNTKRQPVQLAQNANQRTDPNARVVVRQTVPPAQPILEPPQPIVRGQSADMDNDWDTRPMRAPVNGHPTSAPGWSNAPAGQPVHRPAPPPPNPDAWQPARPLPPPTARLGQPLFPRSN